jgi:hypothetical protein
VVTDADDSAINALLARPEQQAKLALLVQYHDVRMFRINDVIAARTELQADR